MITSTQFQVFLHTASSKAFDDGQRLCVLNWKEPSAAAKKLNPAAKKLPSMCVNIPAITLTVQPEELCNLLTDTFHAMQDEAIRIAIETSIGDYSGQTILFSDFTISEDVFSVAGILEANEPKRLSKDMLAKWFDTSLRDNLIFSVAAKAGYTPDKFSTLDTSILSGFDKSVATVKDVLLRFSAPVTPKFNEATTAALIRAVSAADPSSIKQTLLSKLSPKTADVDLADLL